MPESDAVLLATTTPEFFDGGDYLLCKLNSGGKEWAFAIRWSDTELAMQRCGAVLEAHRAKCRGIVPFRRSSKGSLPIPHG